MYILDGENSKPYVSTDCDRDIILYSDHLEECEGDRGIVLNSVISLNTN
jgi:hypothetical protein